MTDPSETVSAYDMACLLIVLEAGPLSRAEAEARASNLSDADKARAMEVAERLVALHPELSA